MIILLLIFFIIYVISYVFLFYKIKVIEEEIETLYDTYFKFIDNSFKGGNKDVV